MKFTCSVEINNPIDEVVRKFQDEDNFSQWQDGFESLEHLSGEKGQPGCKSRIIYKSGKRTIELIETIKSNDLPNEFIGLYEAKEMVNTMVNRFQATGSKSTRYSAAVEYISFHGFMPKLMAKLFPGMFKKQVQKWLDQFKIFCESN